MSTVIIPTVIVPTAIRGFEEGLQRTGASERNDPTGSVAETRVPGAEDFTPRAVNRAVLTETVQHPATILPAAAAAVAGLYLGVIGLEPTAFAIAFGSVLVAVGAWVVNYFLRGEKLAARHVEKLQEKRLRRRFDELASLATEWETTGHLEGIQQARDLGDAYRKLEDFLKERFAADRSSALNLQRLMVLAEDTYREGVVILRQALDIYRALLQTDRGKLESELRAWRGELEALGARDAEGTDAGIMEARISSLESRISAHERRIELHVRQTRTLQELLAESEEIEAALESTHLEAADLGNADAFFARGQSATELERAMNAARRVEERLRGMNEPNQDDDIYLSAGRDSE